MDLKLLKQMVARKDLWLVSCLFLLHNFVLYTWAGWLPQYLTSIGASADKAGLITSVTLWVGLPSVLLLSQLSSRLQRRKPFLWGPTILLAITTFAILHVNIPLTWMIAAFTGIATSVRFSTILALPVEMVEPNQSGSASGMTMSVGYTGALLGPVIGGIILDATGSYTGVFLTLAGLSLITIALTFMVPETGGSHS